MEKSNGTEIELNVAQPLPIGFPFFGNFRPWLCQDYLYYGHSMSFVIGSNIGAKVASRWDEKGGRCFYYHSENNLYFEWVRETQSAKGVIGKVHCFQSGSNSMN